MNYTNILKSVTQRLPLPNQVRNSARGYAYAVDSWTLLDRFLLLGSEDGTYYVSPQKLTVEHADNLINLIKTDGEAVVSKIVQVSVGGKAPKNDPAIFALALAASYGDESTRSAALDALPRVCRTGTHLFQFAEAVSSMRGWGRGLRKAVGRWYNSQPVEALELAAVKYVQRNGWSHRDLLRLAHPKPVDEGHRSLYKWIVDGEIEGNLPLVSASSALVGLSAKEAATLIRENRIPREAVPTSLLAEAEVWEALLEAMPITALIRNLGTLTKVGALHGSNLRKVTKQLTDAERLRLGRVHPLAILNALATYASGGGVRSGAQWEPITAVVDALNQAFYAAFVAARATGKRLLIGLDVSGSMVGTRVAGMAALDCRRACGAMALVAAAVEDAPTFVAFDTESYPLTLSRNRRLDDVVDLLARTGGGGTDCALPIKYAIKNKIEVDAFVIYTDSETWAGSEHPVAALQRYRNTMRIPAKMVVVAMAANRFSIGDQRDPNMLNVVGLDPTVPAVIEQFLA
ncbi:MAG: TROVE domain-containing protein [Fimbriimonadaceae bacterium]